MLRASLVLLLLVLTACDESDDDPSAATQAASASSVGPLSSEDRRKAKPAKPNEPDDANVVVEVSSGSNVSATDAAAIASAMRSGLKRCRPPDGDAEMLVELTVEAEPSGKIRSAEANGETELAADFEECLERRARAAYFPDTESGAKVKLRVRFEKR